MDLKHRIRAAVAAMALAAVAAVGVGMAADAPGDRDMSTEGTRVTMGATPADRDL